MAQIASRDKGEYTIERILEHSGDLTNLKNKEIRFLVKWDGYSESDATWEPYAHVNDVEALTKYLAEQNVKDPEVAKDIKKAKTLEKLKNKTVKKVPKVAKSVKKTDKSAPKNIEASIKTVTAPIKPKEQTCKKCDHKWVCKKTPPEEHDLCKTCDDKSKKHSKVSEVIVETISPPVPDKIVPVPRRTSERIANLPNKLHQT